jgi:DNA-binding beta-propeller fold protein YncE
MTECGGPIPVGAQPQGIAVDPSTDMIYVANSGANSVSVIHGCSVGSPITGVGNHPDAVAVDTAANTIYVAGYFSSNVLLINGATNTLEMTTISVPGANIHDLALDPATNTLYASAYNLGSVAVINTTTDAVTGYLTGNQGPDGLAADATTGYLYSAMNYQSADRIVAYKANTIENVIHSKHDPGNGHTVAVDTATNKVFASVSANPITGAGWVAEFNGASNKVTQYVAVGNNPNGLDVDPFTGLVFVANSGSNTVTSFAG